MKVWSVRGQGSKAIFCEGCELSVAAPFVVLRFVSESYHVGSGGELVRPVGKQIGILSLSFVCTFAHIVLLFFKWSSVEGSSVT